MTEQQARLLTEWLGECWHEQRPTITSFGGPPYRGDIRCKHCSEPMPWLNKPVPSKRLDFTDWRVVGSCIEKSFVNWGIRLTNGSLGWYAKCDYGGKELVGRGDTPQEAIIAAVLAWLEEKQ